MVFICVPYNAKPECNIPGRDKNPPEKPAASPGGEGSTPSVFRLKSRIGNALASFQVGEPMADVQTKVWVWITALATFT
jgi:hypothetical protein